MWKRAFVVSVFFAASPGSYAQALWGDLKAGMTVEQVKTAIPSATMLDQSERRVGSKTGVIALMKADPVDITGMEFGPTFSFTPDGKLTRVELSAVNQSHPEIRAARNRVEVALRTRYGKEVSEKKDALTGIHETTWTNGQINVRLMFLDFPERKSLYVTYEVPPGIGKL